MNEPIRLIQPEPATSGLEAVKTEVGSVFVSNYPPYSFWTAEQISKAHRALNNDPLPDAILGLYLHIPFCRKRCKFCYFRVYTDKNAEEIQSYLQALTAEIRLYSESKAVAGRPLKFVYFGGGTPSFISAKHLRMLASSVQKLIPWKGAEEITFECEPGTLTEAKLEAIREIGVTRLSLGVENFNDAILEENGRAHHSQEIFRVLPWIAKQQFAQLNIDLIAGMVGETWETWRDSVQKTVDIAPESVTIYQMELPFNTVYSHNLHGGAGVPLADWDTKRAWHEYAFDKLEQAGYRISSAYTMVRKDKKCDFVYRDSVWRGSDMIGSGVASFSHMSGVHFQNVAGWNEYMDTLAQSKLPLQRAFTTNSRERLIREMILQLKKGRLQSKYFEKKFGVDIVEEFSAAYRKLQEQGYLTIEKEGVRLTKTGLLRVDLLLPYFYEQKYRNARYT